MNCFYKIHNIQRNVFHVFVLCILLFFWVKSHIISCTGWFSGRVHDERECKHLLAVSWSQYAWKVFEEKYKDKIYVSCLSFCFPASAAAVPALAAVTNYPPLLFLLLPDTSSTLKNDSPHDQVWTGYEGTSGELCSHRVSTTSRPPSSMSRTRQLQALLCTRQGVSGW